MKKKTIMKRKKIIRKTSSCICTEGKTGRRRLRETGEEIRKRLSHHITESKQSLNPKWINLKEFIPPMMQS
jgi:hypothetical protein